MKRLDFVQLVWLPVAIRKLQLYFSTLGGSFLSSWRLQSLTKYRLSSSILQNISPSPLLMSEVTKYLFLNVSETNNKACHKTKDALLNVESRIGYLFKTRIILVTKKYISRMSKQNNVFFL